MGRGENERREICDMTDVGEGGGTTEEGNGCVIIEIGKAKDTERGKMTRGGRETNVKAVKRGRAARDRGKPVENGIIKCH